MDGKPGAAELSAGWKDRGGAPMDGADRRRTGRRRTTTAGGGWEMGDAAAVTGMPRTRTVADLGWMETAAARMDGRWAAKKPETVDGGRRRPMDEEDGAADVMEDGDRRRADGWTVGREKTGNGGRRMATDDG